MNDWHSFKLLVKSDARNFWLVSPLGKFTRNPMWEKYLYKK